jgi:hypothetical protein
MHQSLLPAVIDFVLPGHGVVADGLRGACFGLNMSMTRGNAPLTLKALFFENVSRQTEA